MFDKFGEFNSAEEINRAAAAQLAEGDTEAVMAIALENGLDKDDAEDYIDGIVKELTTPFMAACGKLNVEEKELEPYEIMADWVTYIRLTCEDNPDMAAAVRKKGKSLKGCLSRLLIWSMNNAKPVPDDVLKTCKINYKVTLGIPGMAKAKKLITEYYMEG